MTKPGSPNAMLRLTVFTFCILISLTKVSGRYGGNDIFTSMEAMRRLWQEERQFVQYLEESIAALKSVIPEMER